MKIRKIPPASNAWKYPLLIKNILHYSLILEPEREIIYRDKVRYNYFEFNKRVRKFANLLKNIGLGGGETVGMMDYDSHRYLESYFAIPMSGNVLHTINWRMSPAQILFSINHAEDVVIVVHEDFLPMLESFDGQMPAVKRIIIITDNDNLAGTKLKSDGEYEALLQAQPEDYEFPDFDEDAIATTFYTTGTTGNPKGVFFSHRQIVLHTLGLANTFGFIGSAACRANSNDIYMPLTPLFHVHGWGFPFLATMYSMKQIYIGKFEPEMILKLFAEQKPTVSHCVPTILQMLLSHPAAQALDLNNWKVIIGGAAFPKALARTALQRGVDVITGYGMSETCPVLTTSYIRPKDKDKDLDFQVEARIRTGVPSPFVELKIINEGKLPVQNNDKEMGEIVVRSPWLTQAYYNEPEKSEALWSDGYLHTGDIATVNKRNDLKIADRLKDIIKTGGEWISSVDLENLIGQHPAIAEAAVVSIPDITWSERPHALIVLEPGKELSAEQLKEFLFQFVEKGQISKWAVPQSIDFALTIPKTSVGKIDKKVIRAPFNL